MTLFNIISLNVRGLRQKQKRLSVFDWLKKFHYGDSSFIFMQETHSTSDVELLWKKEWGGEIYFNHGSSNSSGVLIVPPKGSDYHIDYRLMALKVK